MTPEPTSSQDDLTIEKRKRHYRSRTTQTWTPPSDDVLDSIRALLTISKTETLTPLLRSKKLNGVNAELESFIDKFMSKLSKVNMPPKLDLRDFNKDYQIKREKVLKKLCDDERDMIEGMRNTLTKEEKEAKLMNGYIKKYEQMVKTEKRKLEEMDGVHADAGKKKSKRDRIDTLDESITNDKELGSVLQRLDVQLEKLEERFEPLQSLSSKLDDLIQELP